MANVQKRGKCIFCLGYGLTREHIFPDWMRDYLEDRRGNHLNRIVVSVGGGQFKTTHHPGKFNRPGETRGRKLRAVCNTCNNTWMSELQKAAKPILIPFITGKWLTLDPSQQQTLAAWATMFSMVLDATHPENSGVSQEERTSFMQTSTPPPSWLVWIGVCDRPMTAGFLHDAYGAATTLEKIQQLPAGSTLENKTQANMIVCGHAIFHTFSTYRPSILPLISARADDFRIRALWPVSPNWSPEPPQAIPYLEAPVLLERVSRLLGNPGRR